jgi:ATP-dependent exoDNAse (exonuclease V) beta subunit
MSRKFTPVLSKLNPHPRDMLIKFYEKGHRYYISFDQNSKYTSVTTWAHSHFPKFDADAIIANIFRSKAWGPNHKYWGQTAEQIKAGWKANGDAVSGAGTNLHERIEEFMNNTQLVSWYSNKTLFESQTVCDDDCKEWNYFMEFINDYPELKPYRTEWMIFDEDLKIAGCIDMVYENPDGTLSIYDWKRSKDITKVNNWNQYAINPLICHLHDTNFWHYALQLNIYKKILERKYDKTIKDLYLVRLHPDSQEETYELLNVPILEKEVNDLFEEQLHKLKT